MTPETAKSIIQKELLRLKDERGRHQKNLLGAKSVVKMFQVAINDDDKKFTRVSLLLQLYDDAFGSSGCPGHTV